MHVSPSICLEEVMANCVLPPRDSGTDEKLYFVEAPPVEASIVGDADKLLLLEEDLQVSKREVVTGKFRVSTRTETHVEIVHIGLDRDVVDVTRVPVGRIVEVALTVRTENGTMIVPVLEERYVVVKQFLLKEELHIRRCIAREVSRTPVELRRQVAVVEHLDTQGRPVADDGLPHLNLPSRR